MNFLSIEWIAIIVITVSLHWICPSRWRKLLLIVITASFLAVFSLESLCILTIFSVLTYSLTKGERVSLLNLVLSVFFVFAVLSYFKIRFSVAGGKAGDIIVSAAIPLGLSYFSFRCVHFIFERFRNTVRQPAFVDFVGYLFFLPTIVIGPINRFNDYFNQVYELKWSASKISNGLERILFGFVKISVLGNYLASTMMGNLISSIPPENIPLLLYLKIIQDGFTLYFIFAGYSDVAIGFALLLGFRIMENFDNPYLQKNITDFWRGWHISLSSWCRDYVYLPVLGSTRNPYIATLASFSVIGLWHELSLRYITWGLYHGVGILICRQFKMLTRKNGMINKTFPMKNIVVSCVSILLTQHYVFFGLVIVNQPDFKSVLNIYRTVLFFWI